MLLFRVTVRYPAAKSRVGAVISCDCARECCRLIVYFSKPHIRFRIPVVIVYCLWLLVTTVYRVPFHQWLLFVVVSGCCW